MIITHHDDEKHEFEELDLDADLDLGDEDDLNDPELMGYEGVENLDEAPDDALSSSNDFADDKPGVLFYNHKRFAVGLTWLTVNDDEDAALMKERSTNLDADFYCLRNTVTVQHGFGFLDKGHKMGMNAAAALAADALIGEWHGVFSAENGWWYVAVHADTIAPEGDLFFESEEDAYNHFVEQNESHQWPRSYAPESWNIPKITGDIPIEKLVEDMPATILKPSSMNAVFGGKRNKEMALLIGGLFILVLVAALVARETMPNLIPKPKMAKSLQVTAPGILRAPPKEPVKIEEAERLRNTLDRAYLPRPSKVLETCLEGFATLTRSFPGWGLETLRCRNGLAEARWKKGSGSLDSLRPYLSGFPFGVSQSFSGDNLFLASRVIGSLDQFNRETVLPEREAALLTLNDRFARTSSISVKDVIPPRKTPQKKNTVSNTKKKWDKLMGGKDAKPEEPKITLEELPYLAVNIKTNTPPNLTMEYFDIPGLTFDMIEWNIKNQAWVYDARVILKYDRNNAMMQKQTRRR